jgi:hypothetical protein
VPSSSATFKWDHVTKQGQKNSPNIFMWT